MVPVGVVCHQSLVSLAKGCLFTTCLLTGPRFQRPSPRSQKRPTRVFEETLTGKTNTLTNTLKYVNFKIALFNKGPRVTVLC